MRLGLWLFVLIAIAVSAQTGPKNSATKAFHDLLNAEWDYVMREHPEFASTLGDRRFNDRWTDTSMEAIQRRHEHSNEVLTRLAGIQRSSLSPADQLNYDLFKKQRETDQEGFQFHQFLIPLNQREGIQSSDDLADSLPFDSVKDYDDWIARLNAFPALVDQTIALMRQGIQERIVHPKIIMQRLPGQIDKQIVSDPTQSPFYKPFLNFSNNVPPTERHRLEASARKAVEQNIVPTFRKFRKFFIDEYLPGCFDQSGAWQMPRGGELYAFLVRDYTTTSMTPEQVHEKGLQEVARINAEMALIMKKTGFQGSREEFFKFLRTDPQFFYKTPAELLDGYKVVAKTIDPNLVKVFRKLPRQPYGVEPIPDLAAPDTTTAYYRDGAPDGSRAGTFFVNLYRPETRPKWEMMALAMHESVPGHHLQLTLAREMGELPMFRRTAGYTAFVEGWGLYAESLGDEMGLYADPYSKFGQLSYEMWRAVRLVIDTGIHVKHWTREQAIQYFMENCPKQELDITNEVDRYIAWPGQALAYKIGELKFKELRARAQRDLGDKFDVKEFHEVALNSGAVPLYFLERNVNEWIARKKNGANASGN